MVFSSVPFLFFFLPIVLIVYYALLKIKNIGINNIWLLLSSLFFYAWSVYFLKKPSYFFIIIASILVNYFGAIILSKFNKHRCLILFSVIAIDLLILIYFKYFNFLISIINDIFRCKIKGLNIILPIGISFFTFQGLSYVIDVYRGTVNSQKNIIKLALYICLFPQLIAGPIVRYKDVEREIENRKIDIDCIESGAERFIIGLGKKTIIANAMAIIVDRIWKIGITNSSALVLWIGSIAYTLQIYFDFSGYSDMAIGLGRLFGFHFLENFNLPYISSSLTEFWRRWHISLSSFFRDYVYIPLGGNRKHQYLNLLIVFLLTGIWHGASYTFIVWGLLNGVIVILEKLFTKQERNVKNYCVIYIRKIITLFFVNIGWVIFRSPSLDAAVKYLTIMFCGNNQVVNNIGVEYFMNNYTLLVLIIGIIFSSSIPLKIFDVIKNNAENAYLIIKYICLVFVLMLSIILVIVGTYNPFIYFQF